MKFTKMSRYATFRVKQKNETIRFVTDILEELEEECQAAMLHDSIEMSMFMVHF